MSELVWYIFQNGKQVGPFEDSQLAQMLVNGMVSDDAYLFKAGWKEWRPIEDVGDELKAITGGAPGAAPKTAIDPKALAERKKQAPRATIRGEVLAHNGHHLTVAQGANISASGIFLDTADREFEAGETLNLTIRCNGIGKPFNAHAKVIRHSDNPKYGIGYGLKFIDLREDYKLRIEQLVEETNNQPR